MTISDIVTQWQALTALHHQSSGEASYPIFVVIIIVELQCSLKLALQQNFMIIACQKHK